MSFEFDPLENMDRSEDDNDPQDIDSLGGGEEGVFGRVPGKPQVGAANRSQCRPLGDQGLPLGRQGQAQARGGLGQAQGGQAPWSARQAPGLLGMLGRVMCTIPSVSSCFSSIRLCDPHKRILWDFKALSG